MKRLLLLVLLLPLPAPAVTPQAQEFMRITAQLEPVQCEKRRLRREMALAQAERREADLERLRARFAAIDADPRTARLEKRLAVLEARILDGKGRPRNAEDLEAISLQQRQSFYRCD